MNFCGHLRSALDYLAKDIVEAHCPNANTKNRLYFPITPDVVSFNRMMNKLYPDLQSNCKSIYDILESIQPYQNDRNRWLVHIPDQSGH